MKRKALAIALFLGAPIFACGDDPGSPASSEEVELEVGPITQATLGAAGGKLELAGTDSWLEIPEGALATETNLGMRDLRRGGRSVGVHFEPNGLKFARPAVLHIHPAPDTVTFGAALVSDDGTPEFARLLGGDADAGVRIEIPHFSTAFPLASQYEDLFAVQRMRSAPPWTEAVNVPFMDPATISLRSRTAEQFFDVNTETTTKKLLGTMSLSSDPVLLSMFPRALDSVTSREADRVVIDKPVNETSKVSVSPKYVCLRAGGGNSNWTVRGKVNGTATLRGYAVDASAAKVPSSLQYARVLARPGTSVTIPLAESVIDIFRSAPVTCESNQAALDKYLATQMGLQPAQEEEVSRAQVPAWNGECTMLSDGKRCDVPKPAQTLVSVLGVFPTTWTPPPALLACGQTNPVRVVCPAGADASPVGPWMITLGTFAAEIPQEDPAQSMQLAVVLDADGEPSNNYKASAQYPKDFFQGTDLWFEAIYSPGAGWKVRVRDVRKGPADLVSSARFLLLGNQFAVLVPRSEIDGANPTFRLTSFAHQGDFGLQGGPWSGSYYPGLTFGAGYRLGVTF